MKIAKWLALAFICMASPVVLSQTEMGYSQESKGPEFHMDVVNMHVVNNPGLSRLNVLLEIVYDNLQFVKDKDGYKAGYEISVIVQDKSGEQVDGKTWSESLNANSFNETNKQNRYSLANHSFDVEPGKYKVIVKLQDAETNLAEEKVRQVEAKNFASLPISLSGIAFVSKIDFDSAGIARIRPQITDISKGIMDTSFAFFEIYQSDSLKEADLSYKIQGNQSKKIARGQYKVPLSGNRTYAYIPLHADSLQQDAYKLTIELTSGKEKISEEKEFYVRWSALPSNAVDLETAIDQLRYVAGKAEWKLLHKAKGDQRLEAFKDFWKRHDPTPGTEANEAMDMHYNRIEYANRNFSVMHRDGWRTDMGMVFIILGAPDDVERNAYPRYTKPYEIWYYYRYNHEFVFLDYTGFNDYRLEDPYSIYEIQRLAIN
jgi:GWxTD domain-containing protein